MKISNISLFLFGFMFCVQTSTCDTIRHDDKIKLKIEVLNKDDLLSADHLKVQKKIVHNGKKINIKVFEKINKDVLERALVVEEIDETNALSKDAKKELLSLRRAKNDSEEESDEEEVQEDTEETENDEEMRVISTEESTENDVHMVRKVYKETEGNKEITYCYMVFSFNLDLEKLNEVSRSELFKSLDKMPDYLSFLSPNEKISDTEQLLKEENDQLYDNSGDDDAKFSGVVSAAELSANLEEREVNIVTYITTLDDIINYIVSRSNGSTQLPAFYKELLKEREHLYKLSLKGTMSENIADEEYWKNKSKVDKYFLFEALTHLKNFYLDGAIKRAEYMEHTEDNTMYDDTAIYEKFVNLTDKTIKCHALLDTTEILDLVILENLDNGKEESENENKEDKEILEQCINLYKLLLNNKKHIIKHINNHHRKHTKKHMDYADEKTEDTILMDKGKTFDELLNIAEEKFPVKRYILRKEAPKNDEIVMSFEHEDLNKEDHDAQEMSGLFDSTSNIDEIGEKLELYENPEDEFMNEIISEGSEEEHIMDHSTFLEYNEEGSNDDIATEMFNEDTGIADETEEEHKADILEVLKLERQKMIENDMNKKSKLDTESNQEEFTKVEDISETPESEEQNINSFLQFDNEISDDMVTEISNQDTDIANRTEQEHNEDVRKVLNLERQQMLHDDMNQEIESDEESGEEELTREEEISEAPETEHEQNIGNSLQFDKEISDNMTNEISNKDADITEEEHKEDVRKVLNLERQQMLHDDKDREIESNDESGEEELTKEENISETPEMKYEYNADHFFQFDNELSNNMTNEMSNDYADIMEKEHNNDIRKEFNLKRQQMLRNDLNKEIKYDETPVEELIKEENILETPEMQNEKTIDGFLQFDNEVSHDDIATEMFNEDTGIADETEEEHKDDILKVLKLERQKMLDNDMNTTKDRYIQPHNNTISSYLENKSSIQDMDDDDDDDIFSSDDTQGDIFSVDDDNAEGDIFSEDSDNVDVTEVQNDADDGDDEIEDDDDDDDDDDENDEDDDEEDNSNEKLSDKLKRKAKSGFKSLLNKGKIMAKDALSNMVDEAENHVKKLTTQASKGLKKKLKTPKKNKKNSKNKKNKNKNKNKSSKKSVKKSGSKGIKKDKKKEKKGIKTKKGILKTPAKTKKGKGLKSVSSLEVENEWNGFDSVSNNSFIDLADTSNKSFPSNINMKRSINKNSERPNSEKKDKLRTFIKTKRENNPKAKTSLNRQDRSIELEKSDMDRSFLDLADASNKSFPSNINMKRSINEKLERLNPEQKDKLRTFMKTKRENNPKAKTSLNRQDRRTGLKKSVMDGSFLSLKDSSNKLHIKNSNIKEIVKMNARMADLEDKKKKLMKELEKPSVSDEKIINDFENYIQKEHKKKEKKSKN